MTVEIGSCDRVDAADGKPALAELISSGLVQHLVPFISLRDLQSLENVGSVLRQLTDSLVQPDWRAVAARIVPATHYLTGVSSGQPRAAGCSAQSSQVVLKLVDIWQAAIRRSAGSSPLSMPPPLSSSAPCMVPLCLLLLIAGSFTGLQMLTKDHSQVPCTRQAAR